MNRYDLDYSGLPEGLRGGVERWIEWGVVPGDFLRAVIRNDLKEACGLADDKNGPRLQEIVAWFYNQAPHMCWGSRERFEAWWLAGEDSQRRRRGTERREYEHGDEEEK